MKVAFDVESYLKVLKAKLLHGERFLLDGRCKDYAEYKLYVGERRGLLSAIDEVKDVLAKTNEDNDDE